MKHWLSKIKIIWMTAAVISLLSSCVKEMGTGDPPDSGKTALVKLEARAIGGNELDNRIKSVRILTFGPGDFVNSNIFYDEATIDAKGGIIIHEMKSGVQNFVFIANENNGAEQNDLTAAVFTGKRKSDLSGISLPASAFNQTDVIPMLTAVDNVMVLPGSEGIKVDNGPVQTTWPVQMKRLAVRIDMTVKSKSDMDSQLKGVTFPNVANAVPLTGNYSGAQNTTRTITIADNPDNFEPYTPTQADIDSGYIWGKKVVRIILPSHMFADKTNTGKALKMGLIMDGWSENPFATIGYNEPSDNTLPHNTNFTGEGIIAVPLLHIYLKAANWDVRDADGDIDEIRTLNVSAIKEYVIDYYVRRIYFNSNQENVCIDITAKNSSGADVNVNTILQNPTTTNFHYDYNAAAGTGTGYVDLSTAAGAKGGVYKIYLNAGGLRRELKVSIMKTNIAMITASAYVGTFHRWNETDERRITIPGAGNTPAEIQGDWVAIVAEGKDWIRMDAEAFGSNGGKVGIENTPVDGNATASKPIRFRVGLTGNHPSGPSAGPNGNAHPRYGVIYIYYGNDLSKVHKIYVRQGEAADYLMRNIAEDNPLTGPMAGVQRTLAAKISPYNLTDPNGGNGRVGAATGTKYTFTKYPSQSGYYFQWYQTYAWSPSGTETTNWISTNSSTALWDPNKALWESCPAGYRRVNDGSTTAHVSATDAATSVWRQSLYLNPTFSGGSSLDNSVWGFLADGFFDRGIITTPEGINVIENTAVSPGTANVAYIGRLYYNPNNNASVFLPGAGLRRSNSGQLEFPGSHGFCWSSTSYSTDSGWVMHYGSSASNQYVNIRQYALSIRCVRE